MRLEVAGTGYDNSFDWDNLDQPLQLIGAHQCCGSSERCWTCADNEELASIMAEALKAFVVVS